MRRTAGPTIQQTRGRQHAHAPCLIIAVIGPSWHSLWHRTGSEMVSGYCKGTDGRPCRAGRGNGPAVVRSGTVCGTCRRRKRASRVPAGAAKHAAVQAAHHDDSPMELPWSFKMDPLGGAYTAVDEANNDTYRISSNSSTAEFAMDRRFAVNSKRDGIGVFRSLDNAKAAAQADSDMRRQRSVDNPDPTGRYMPGAARCRGPQGCCDPEICDGRGYHPAIVIVTTGAGEASTVTASTGPRTRRSKPQQR